MARTTGAICESNGENNGESRGDCRVQVELKIREIAEVVMVWCCRYVARLVVVDWWWKVSLMCTPQYRLSSVAARECTAVAVFCRMGF
jgi:hypothetical protein